MGRRDIGQRNDLLNSLRMIGGAPLAALGKGQTDAVLRQMIEAALKSREV